MTNLPHGFYRTAATVSFSESMYSVDENGTSVELALDLSNPSSANVNFQILVEGGTATG